VYAVGDVANVPAPDGSRTRSWARSPAERAVGGRNVVADVAGTSRKPFHYHDKGIMAMIGRGAPSPRSASTGTSCTAGRVRLLARRARLPDERGPQPGRRVHVLGLGLLQHQPHAGDRGPVRRRRIDWGRRGRRRRRRRGRRRRRRGAAGASGRVPTRAGPRTTTTGGQRMPSGRPSDLPHAHAREGSPWPTSARRILPCPSPSTV
jgi:hypothetical protein